MKELAEFIKNGESFAVISHISPDGDTMGCASAVIYALEKMGKKAQWFCEGTVPEDFMKIEEFASLVERRSVARFDSALCVDISSIDRMGNCIDLFKHIPRKAQIDHHITNTAFADVNYAEPVGACSLLVIKLIEELGVEFDTHIARALYTGIMTDTGRLSHADVRAEDVMATAKLFNYNINQTEIIDIICNTVSYKTMKMRGIAASHMETALDGKVTYTYLEPEDYAEFEADGSHSEGVINMCRSVEGTKVAFFLRKIPLGYKVSMRCVEGYNVAELCASLGGGGHELAAGCTVEGQLWDVVRLLIGKIEAMGV